MITEKKIAPAFNLKPPVETYSPLIGVDTTKRPNPHANLVFPNKQLTSQPCFWGRSWPSVNSLQPSQLEEPRSNRSWTDRLVKDRSVRSAAAAGGSILRARGALLGQHGFQASDQLHVLGSFSDSESMEGAVHGK